MNADTKAKGGTKTAQMGERNKTNPFTEYLRKVASSEGTHRHSPRYNPRNNNPRLRPSQSWLKKAKNPRPV